MSMPTRCGPTESRARARDLDAVRGGALLGIVIADLTWTGWRA
jgi:uncharacterized membrane protein YeiB